MQVNDLKIDRIAMNGYGIGNANGKTIFVPYTLPGDVVNVLLTHIRKDIAFAEVTAFVSRHSKVIDPICDAFGIQQKCGGCDWLDCDYESQVKIKTSLLQQTFEKSISTERRLSVSPSPEPYHYRNKVFLPVSQGEKGLQCGMYQRYSHKVIPHQSCRIQDPLFDPICQKILQICNKTGTSAYDEVSGKGILRHIGLRTNADNSSILVIIVCKSRKLPFTKLLVKELVESFPMITGIIQNIQREQNNVILGDEEILLFGNPYLIDSIGKLKFQLHYRSFFQINRSTTHLMYEHIKNALKPGSRVIDAYCGVGTISLYLADKADTVLGIEENLAAITDAKINSELNSCSNTAFICAKVEDWFINPDRPMDYDTIIFDPPRKGLEHSIIEQVSQSNIRHIIYVSCNPMTMRRDINLLQDHCFDIDQIHGFDMFPQTWHIECVASLHRR